jgi:uncharacterized repeat protein (TIGR01451 family)
MKRERIALLITCLTVSLAPLFLFDLHLQTAFTDADFQAVPENFYRASERFVRSRSRLDEPLRLALLDSEPGDLFRVIVHLQEKAELNYGLPPGSVPSGRAEVVARLKQTAAASQGHVLEQMRTMQDAGEITAFRPLWIINGVAATVTADAIQHLAAIPEIEAIKLDAQHRYFDPPEDTIRLETIWEAAASSVSVASWGIDRIRAPQVWYGLGVDGQGVTVAIMDSGVDWSHPDLVGNYRGNLGGGSVIHDGNWYNAADPTVTVPTDTLGHGTHVAGTAVGQNGIGVAPGARWIAVAITDENGFIYDSSIHFGFQWLLAPDGNPALAPDIVNNSWGGPSYITTFVDDLAVLNAAGMITVFSAGNAGPFQGTVTSPASYTGTLSVGASDDIDAVAWFSSRGPSPLTGDLKPWVVAPGTRIYSAAPDGRYGLSNGTSMATPHVAGTIALLKSANASLTQPEIQKLLAGTAVSLSATHPNYDSGWGRLDAFSAVWPQVQTGAVRGVVRGAGIPLSGVSITVTTSLGNDLSYQTDRNGTYMAILRPGTYNVAASAFGYAPSTSSAVVVTVNQTISHDIDLVRLPSGEIRGVVRQEVTGTPLTATVKVTGTPVTVTTDTGGAYTLTLPGGLYDLQVTARRHRLGQSSVIVSPAQISLQGFTLAPSPAVLLVDSGQWYYESYAEYYRSALTGLNYTNDTWVIRNPFQDIPTSADLQAYDIVAWSSPLDSPGYLAANNIITDYLGYGGNLLISGQNVGNFDGEGFGTQIWWYRDLKGVYSGKTAVTQTLTGTVDTIFTGISLTLNGGDSANNQILVDTARPRPDSLTEVGLWYDNGSAGSLVAGQCDPFRIVYLGFGLEGVSDGGARTALLDRSLAFFNAPPLQTGVQWNDSPIDDFALAGSQLVYTLTLRNLSETVTDTFQLDVSNALWPSSLATTTLTLGKCETGQTVLTIDVPDDAPTDFTHTISLTAISSNDNSVVSDLLVRHKTPGHVLLVDDDRWYDQEATFRAALDAMDLRYDVWEIGWDQNVRGSPSVTYLNEYDIVIWYTGYDWFAPITAEENQALSDYLSQGGRLFLTSQDFMYYHHTSQLAQTYFGVVEYRESITPTMVYGGDNPVLPTGLAGSLPLDYGVYQNNGDGLIPADGSRPFIWHDQGMAAGVATADPNWRTIFWGIPFEKLPPATHPIAMNAVVGWLSDLGDSTFEVDGRTGAPSVPRSYTITLRNLDIGRGNQVWMTNTLPTELTLLPGSIAGGAVYDATAGRLTWQGVLGNDDSHQISYMAVPGATLTDGTRIDNPIYIHYDRHDIRFVRDVTIWVNAPDLSRTTLTADVTSPAPLQAVTYTLLMQNHGLSTATMVSAVVRLPDELNPVSSTLETASGVAVLKDRHVNWVGDLDVGSTVTVSLVMTRTMAITPLWLPTTAIIADGVTDAIVRDVYPYLRPYELRLPLIAKD